MLLLLVRWLAGAGTSVDEGAVGTPGSNADIRSRGASMVFGNNAFQDRQEQEYDPGPPSVSTPAGRRTSGGPQHRQLAFVANEDPE